MSYVNEEHNNFLSKKEFRNKLLNEFAAFNSSFEVKEHDLYRAGWNINQLISAYKNISDKEVIAYMQTKKGTWEVLLHEVQ